MPFPFGRTCVERKRRKQHAATGSATLLRNFAVRGLVAWALRHKCSLASRSYWFVLGGRLLVRALRLAIPTSEEIIGHISSTISNIPFAEWVQCVYSGFQYSHSQHSQPLEVLTMPGNDRSPSQVQADVLEERLIDFAVRLIRLSASLPKTTAGKHIAGQILRSGTSPAPIMERLEGLRAAPTLYTRFELY
jgi:hypothetical protein